eukprot:4520847-Ditylum_brightwellii.AAC.1
MVVGGKWNCTINQGAAFESTPVQAHLTTTPTSLPAVTTPQPTMKDGKCHFYGGVHLQPECAK